MKFQNVGQHSQLAGNFMRSVGVNCSTKCPKYNGGPTTPCFVLFLHLLLPCSFGKKKKRLFKIMLQNVGQHLQLPGNLFESVGINCSMNLINLYPHFLTIKSYSLS
ncbi:hypothetical protein OWV82_013860 [Melia azedarach]|uniref:Uncharacterized protein n=1 Tax=Melia azedarach TaxID=155640 RepID=A0ACC1XVN3_MELAZ|nr:hypothetical protein OWV82_013860 [Melia azedarach]